MSETLNYFRERAAEERTRAVQASDPKVRAIHLELALRYDEAVRGTVSEKLIGGARKAIEQSFDLLRSTSDQISV